MRGLTIEIILSFFLMSAAMDAEEKQRYMSYYNCHYANMLPGEGEAWENILEFLLRMMKKKFSKTKDNHHDKKAWERAKEEFVTSTMVGASNAPVPTTACVAWVCDPNLMVWQVWP